jgi:bifunctional non-homologous end joining protein LigD
MSDPDRDALEEYRSKRDFDRTAEPSGDAPRSSLEEAPRRVFVVQKHDASRLHYDFRLELDGVLKSWAVPKGPSLDPADKRLAVMVEDHPLDYAHFEGSIPEGEYGGGTVMLWDSGWWQPDVDWMKEAKGSNKTGAGKAGAIPSPAEALAKGELKFVVHGKKLTGSWALIKTRWQGENNWLLIKHRDDAARPGSDIEKEAPDSVATGRSLEQIAMESTARAAAPAGDGAPEPAGDAAAQG